ncbi:ENDOPLASMIC RETICULUM MULTISPAN TRANSMEMBRANE PROTEIN-RELATED [Salix purpurea]|uniref:Protein RFT1 homolog n=1 Tax=Salix purpurea TaxID=77065 RepID=A0A9Q0T9B7_SALPP|nr:ENDOPLASMIC RETICULUM MULTISPAN TRANSMEMBRANE PROTEIN-RELATED [Salix purpurea]
MGTIKAQLTLCSPLSRRKMISVLSVVRLCFVHPSFQTNQQESLVVRLVFLPFEESSYATFSRSASGLVFMAFGPSYSYSFIRLLYGHKWTDGEALTALQYYCLYVIVLAVNDYDECPTDKVIRCCWLDSGKFLKCRFLWWTFFIAIISPCTQAHHVHAISIVHGHETEFCSVAPAF